MRLDINRSHPLSAIRDYHLSTIRTYEYGMHVVSKTYYPHMRMLMAILGYANAIINRISILFMYYIYINSPKRHVLD